MREPALLSIRNLSVVYPSPGGPLRAVDRISLDVAPGETVAIIGESGSGKSTIALAVMDLIDRRVVDGQIFFKGTEISALTAEQRRRLRGQAMSLVFQDPFTSLNPGIRIGAQVAEGLIKLKGAQAGEAHERAIAALAEVGLANPQAVARAYPHQLSDGMRQRVLIASALICDPDLIILDEPTTALDVTVEAQILELIKQIAARRRLGVLFITHNLGVVNRIADRVCILYAGRVLESGPKAAVLGAPLQPYSKGLLTSVPRLVAGREPQRLAPIGGEFPDLTDPLAGCIFQPRCPFAEERCGNPQALDLRADGRSVRCWKADGLASVGWPKAADADAGQSALPGAAGTPLVVGRHLKKSFRLGVGGPVEWRKVLGVLPLPSRATTEVRAVDDVTLELNAGETLGLVGESGSGKSTLGRVLLRLIDTQAGDLSFGGADVTHASEQALKPFRRCAQIVFQNPDSSLNPRRSVGDAVARVVTLFGTGAGRPTRERVEELFHKVGLPRRYYDRFPHQLSGGEKQRVGIARALASNPQFIVCDEPVSALDVSVQATILNLLADLKRELGLAYLFISHDLAVVAHVADRIAVLYHGRIVEEGPTQAVLAAPHHPYTEVLFSAAPSPDPEHEPPPRIAMRGDGSSRPTAGCIFQNRCPRKIGTVCETVVPPAIAFPGGHRISCHLSQDDLLAGAAVAAKPARPSPAEGADR